MIAVSSVETGKTHLGLTGPTIITNDRNKSDNNTDSSAGEHPVVLAEPPGPPSAEAHAQLPSLAALALSDPVERSLPDAQLTSSSTNTAVETTPATINNVATGAVPSKGGENLAYTYPPPPSGDETAGSLPYPPATPHLTRAPIEIATKDPTVGRGVFATAYIPAGEVVEISPVLVLDEKEYKGRSKGETDDGTLKGVEASQLRGYVFTWGRDGSMAVALGIGSLFNHSSSPNVTYSLDYSQYTISYRTAKPVRQGEELTIFYGHSVRFSGTDNSSEEAVVENDAIDDGWGGLGGLDAVDEEASEGAVDPDEKRLAHLRSLSPQELSERDNEIIGPDEPDFHWKKVTELIDPEDAELTTMSCYAIDVPARHSSPVFQFVRKHASRKFNELAHLKRVRPIASRAPSPSPPPAADEDGDAERSHRSDPDQLQSVLLFPVASAPADLVALLAASPLASALAPAPVPAVYTVDVPAEAARTEKQAREWGAVWPVQVVHVREGAKAVKRKKGWERAQVEWVQRQAEKVWERAQEAGRRGEHPIACRVTDSWSADFHTSLHTPLKLVTAHDTRLSTGNVLSHAASNAIDAVAVLDLQGGRPPLHLFGPDAANPPYLLTGLTVFLSHEPCLLCAMSLLHSRIKQLYYIKRAPGAGGCGSLYSVHEDGGLNHRFEVWEWDGAQIGGIGVGQDDELRLDP
ncbi:Tad3p [Rhodotorula paludigena]|uniref:Tad3p n=1 Tax=Rhodotorula paludigena TaxID=86838 RepID=UPI0031710F24